MQIQAKNGVPTSNSKTAPDTNEIICAVKHYIKLNIKVKKFIIQDHFKNSNENYGFQEQFKEFMNGDLPDFNVLPWFEATFE